jgi:hypothetical protein
MQYFVIASLKKKKIVMCPKVHQNDFQRQNVILGRMNFPEKAISIIKPLLTSEGSGHS